MSTGLVISIISGLATSIGGSITIFFKELNKKSISLFLGLASGISLTIVFFDLLPAAYRYGSLLITASGFFLGALLMFIFDRAFPHAHLDSDSKAHDCSQNCLHKVSLFYALGIILHNLPEGLAIGAGYEITPRLGLLLATTIGLHNIPEGMTLSVALRAGGMKKIKTLLLSSLVGLIIPLGTLTGRYIYRASQNSMALFLAIGSGTLLFIIIKELLPESFKQHYKFAGAGVTLGIVSFSLLNFLQ